jgi:catechol 2,3-dioxygenase-like lactoylglutathione lyase family enzyme
MELLPTDRGNAMTVELHHVAYVVNDLAESTRHWETRFGARVESPATLVTAHGVLVSFLLLGDTRIELVQPARQDAACGKHPRQPGTSDHLGFFCSDFDERVASVRDEGGLIVREPVPSEAFGGRRMCFVFYPNVGLVEWIER